MQQNILVADIGATNSRFAVFMKQPDRLSMHQCWKKKTQDYCSFHELIDDVQHDMGMTIDKYDKTVFAIPGPITNGQLLLPNIKWNIETSLFSDVIFINDFAAQAYACFCKPALKTLCIKRGLENVRAVKAVVGPGTGIGFCSIQEIHDHQYATTSSELCHAMFPLDMSSKMERDLSSYICQRFARDYATPDLLVSARGLQNLHHFLTNDFLTPTIIIQKQCTETTNLYTRLLARICRHYCLSVMSIGGLFITGGLAIKNPDIIDSDVFRNEFCKNTILQDILHNIEIRLHTNEDSGLWGAASYVTHN